MPSFKSTVKESSFFVAYLLVRVSNAMSSTNKEIDNEPLRFLPEIFVALGQ